MNAPRKIRSFVSRRLNWLFIVIVAIPTIGSAIYYSLFASDVFISTAKFTVKSQGRSNSLTTLGSILQEGGIGRAADDAVVVRDFLESRGVVATINTEFKLMEHFSSPKVDFWNRFPQLFETNSFEAFYDFIRDRIRVVYDSGSGITTVTTRTHDAKLSAALTRKLLTEAEHFTGTLNDRFRQDAIRAAIVDVNEAEDRSRRANSAVVAYRTRRGVFDPERQGTLKIQQSAKLQDEIISLRIQLAQLKQLSPQNPQIPTLERRIATTERESSLETQPLTSAGTGIATTTNELERLQLDRQFAERQLAGALQSLDSARADARRRHLYVDVVAQPNIPDVGREPRRIRSIITVFIFSLVIFAIASLIKQAVSEHD